MSVTSIVVVPVTRSVKANTSVPLSSKTEGCILKKDGTLARAEKATLWPSSASSPVLTLIDFPGVIVCRALAMLCLVGNHTLTEMRMC